MHGRRRLAAIALLVSVVAMGCYNWRGPGFSAGGPEMPRLRHELTLAPGMSVADVGAGRGELTVALAAELGPSGRVYATDIDPEALEQIRTRVAAAALRNVTILKARARDTGLPTGCCDAVVLRRVYHHLSDPAATNLDLLRALRPGGVLAIIDFPPMLSWLWPWSPKDTSGSRTGHGVAAGLVVAEVTAGGFTLVKVLEDWPGRGPLKSYCAIFRKPEPGPRAASRNPVAPPVPGKVRVHDGGEPPRHPSPSSFSVARLATQNAAARDTMVAGSTPRRAWPSTP